MPQEIQLRPSQLNFVQAQREAMAQGHRKIIACAATGFGKSVVIAATAKMVLDKGGRVNIILPRKSLVVQLSATFSKYGIEHTILMAGEPYYSPCRCQIISIDTYISRMNSGKMGFIDASLLLIDEAHSQHSDKKIQLFNKYKNIIGFTATPSTTKKKPLNLVYSKIVESVGIGDLVELGQLLPFKYFAPSDFHPEKIRTDADGEYIDKDLNEYIDSKLKDESGRAMLVGDIFTNWQKIAGDRQTVIFCKTQAHATAVCDEFISKGVRALYIDCNTEMQDRAAIFDDINAERAQVIVNVNIVSMGVDLPILSCVVLATPINKVHRYHQACGRASRPYNGQSDAIIIDHCGTVAKLGFVDDEQNWTLDGKETVEERNEKAKQDKKAPKEITCGDCGNVYKSSRNCPRCGFESLKEGEAMSYHQAELQEVKKKDKKPTPAEKAAFYAELLGYCKQKNKKTSYALAMFQAKYKEWPNKKHGVSELPPTKETLSYIKSRNIAYAKKRGR